MTPSPAHVITLSFDDGSRRSFIRVAVFFEQAGLRGCFNVTATGSMGGDEHEKTAKGDWVLWNELAARGHEVMPHGYEHRDKSALPFEQGKELILRCLGVFGEKLKGFDRRTSVFNFPYNRTTPELEAWVPTVVRAFRGGLTDGLNPLPSKETKAIRTTGFGPGLCEDHLDQHIDILLKRPTGWLVYNLHGLEGEGWGPIREKYLQRLLDRLLTIPTVRVIPTARALP